MFIHRYAISHILLFVSSVVGYEHNLWIIKPQFWRPSVIPTVDYCPWIAQKWLSVDLIQSSEFHLTCLKHNNPIICWDIIWSWIGAIISYLWCFNKHMPSYIICRKYGNKFENIRDSPTLQKTTTWHCY